jgi:hypothetical protein
MKTTTLQFKHSMNLPPVRLAFVIIPLALGCFALLPQARADCQEGCDIGHGNTFLGDYALLSNTTGTFNTATGAHALKNNTTGYRNTAIGNETLVVNTTGSDNTAIGDTALWSNTAHDNTATGSNALYFDTSGFSNTATGSYAMFAGRTGSNNTATGASALWSNAGGSNNTANGQNALRSNVVGSNNIALGQNAGFNITGNNNIDIGHAGVAGESGVVRLGTEGAQTATFIAGIRQTPIAGAIQVGIDANGQLGIRGSSERFKKDIAPMDKTSESILALKPVTFRYKHDLDPEGIPQFGLVAEEVAKVNPDLVVRDAKGEIYTVRYEAVNAMLLNEFLKEHRKNDKQETTIAELRAEIATLAATVKEQAAQIQKVSAQLKTSNLLPQTIASNH